jgi:hypothetical protein
MLSRRTPRGDKYALARQVDQAAAQSTVYMPGVSAGGGSGSTGDANTVDGYHASAFLAPAYLVLSLNDNLINERVLTLGNGLQAVDGGSGGAYTLSAKLAAASGLVVDANGLRVGAGLGIQVNAGDVALASSVAGAGLGYSAGVLAVGAGTLVAVGADTVGLSNGSAAYQIPLTGTAPNYNPAWTSLAAIPELATLASAEHESQVKGWGIAAGGHADFRTLYATELYAKRFVADLEQALAGSQIIAKSVAIIAAAFTVPAKGASATLTVEDLPGTTANVFADDDYVRVRNVSRDPTTGELVVADAYGTVTFSSHSGSAQTYTFARPVGDTGTAAGGTVVAAKGLALDYGESGDGYYEVTTLDAAGSPYAQVVTWDTLPGTGHETVQVRMGQLSGVNGGTPAWGLAFGSGKGLLDASGLSISGAETSFNTFNAVRWLDEGDEVANLAGGKFNAGLPIITLSANRLHDHTTGLAQLQGNGPLASDYALVSAEGFDGTSGIYMTAHNATAATIVRIATGGMSVDTSLKIGTGLYVGSTSGTVVDDCIIADGSGSFKAGLNVGTAVSAGTGEIKASADVIAGTYTKAAAGIANGHRLGVSSHASSRNWGLVSDVDAYGDCCLMTEAAKDGGLSLKRLRVDPSGNVWVPADLSALTFTDRTPYPDDATALAAVRSMARDAATKGLDHAKLHPYIARGGGGRDLSATVSAQNVVIQQLLERVERLEKAS